MTPFGKVLTSRLKGACVAASLKPGYVLHLKIYPKDITFRWQFVYRNSSNHEKHSGRTLRGQWSSGLGETHFYAIFV